MDVFTVIQPPYCTQSTITIQTLKPTMKYLCSHLIDIFLINIAPNVLIHHCNDNSTHLGKYGQEQSMYSGSVDMTWRG